jgi:myo-inositol-1(or 4)-monophosphatase
MTKPLRDTLFLALRRAGALIKKNIDRPNKVQYKRRSPINLVTWVDHAADRVIRKTIQSRFPDHNLLTEESTPKITFSPYKWIVDPLDGTTNYAHHYPQVCVSIGLEYSPHPALRSALSLGERAPKGWVRQRNIILAGVFDPLRDELFWAEKGRGAWLEHGKHRRRVCVSPTHSLSHSLLLTGFPYDRRARIDLYLSYVKAFMQKIQGIRRAGAAALDLCWVACGRVDGYWEWRLKPWDVAAGKLIVEEAGGRLSDFSGNPFDIYGEQTLATNGRIHNEMLRLMHPLKR